MQIQTRRAASIASDPRTAARELFEALHVDDLALAIFHCSPSYDLEALGAALSELFGCDAPLIGCTTVDHGAPDGPLERSISGVSLAGPGVLAHTERIDRLRDVEPARSEAAARRALHAISHHGIAQGGASCFGFVLCDGLAIQEEALIGALYGNLHGIQLVGGSAGDGARFASTHLYHGGRFHTDCALFTLMSIQAAFKVFKTEHFTPSVHKLVVTGADPARRIVTEINGHPAAREYARKVGIAADQLTPATFDTRPVAVSIAGNWYVRSIEQVNDDGSLSFHGAIDEGTVLTVARTVDVARNLEQMFAGAPREPGPPGLVLGYDCTKRYLEIEQLGCRAQIGTMFADHRAVGLAIDGEPYSAM